MSSRIMNAFTRFLANIIHGPLCPHCSQPLGEKAYAATCPSCNQALPANQYVLSNPSPAIATRQSSAATSVAEEHPNRLAMGPNSLEECNDILCTCMAMAARLYELPSKSEATVAPGRTWSHGDIRIELTKYWADLGRLEEAHNTGR